MASSSSAAAVDLGKGTPLGEFPEKVALEIARRLPPKEAYWLLVFHWKDQHEVSLAAAQRKVVQLPFWWERAKEVISEDVNRMQVAGTPPAHTYFAMMYDYFGVHNIFIQGPILLSGGLPDPICYDPLIEKAKSAHHERALVELCKRSDRAWRKLLIRFEPQPASEGKTTLLHWAATYGHTCVAQYLLSCSIEHPRSRDEEGQTALEIARGGKRVEIANQLAQYEKDYDLIDRCSRGTFEGVAELVHADANLEATNFEGLTPLQIAGREYLRGGVAHLGIITGLLALGANAEALYSDGDSTRRTLLHRACERGQPEGAALVAILIEHGVGLETKDEEGRSPLHVACNAQNWEAARRLLAAGAKATVRSPDGTTPLHIACDHSQEGIVKELLEGYGADYEARDAQGRTPLHAACSKGAIACVQELLGAGANVRAVDSRSHTPLHLACRHSSSSCATALLIGGADPNARDACQQTPMHIASAACVRALLAQGADIEAEDLHGNTPLHTACSRAGAATVGTLLKRRASPRAKNRSGNTPLHLAAFARDGLQCVEALLASGADLEAKGQDNATPLHMAYYGWLRMTYYSGSHSYRMKHQTIQATLIARGADTQAKNRWGKVPSDALHYNSPDPDGKLLFRPKDFLEALRSESCHVVMEEPIQPIHCYASADEADLLPDTDESDGY